MNKFFNFTKEVFTGKSLGRILFNWQVQKHCQNLKGISIDLAAGSNPSYYRYWGLDKNKVIKVDYKEKEGVDVVANLNHDLPFKDNHADNIFLFNAIYIIEEPKNLLREIRRVLKPGGIFFFNSPLINNEAPEPNDYRRLTSQGLTKLLEGSGFSNFEIIPLGERFSAGVNLWHSFFIFNFIRFFAFAKALLLDKLIPKKIKKLHPCPISYFVIAKK
ncbi:MAG: class I SAM-dependent methyltransferase [Patescibacteria group bacterium]|nr:class I SAM-dependent methyltransferase [Patescibacteria group bacterium]